MDYPVQRITQPYKLASRQFHPEDSVISMNGFSVGGNEVSVIAGPCSVESRSQIIETAIAVKEAGASALRGGVFKPRTSPYSFQGLGEEGLELLAEAREKTGLPIVVEIMSQVQLDVMVKYVDVLQVGARNMQNFNLLRAIGESRTAVLLKRGLSATVEELLMSAEYILAGGNQRVMLCERGIRHRLCAGGDDEVVGLRPLGQHGLEPDEADDQRQRQQGADQEGAVDELGRDLAAGHEQPRLADVLGGAHAVTPR